MRARVLEPMRNGQIVQLTFGPIGNAQLSCLDAKREPYGIAKADLREGGYVELEEAVEQNVSSWSEFRLAKGGR